MQPTGWIGAIFCVGITFTLSRLSTLLPQPAADAGRSALSRKIFFLIMNLNNLLSTPTTLDLGDYVLRPLRPSDASAWYAYLSDVEVTRLTSYQIESMTTVTKMIEGYLAGYSQKTSTRWAIARKDSDTLIGTCGYYWWNSSHSIAELGYDLSRTYWGKGVMTNAVHGAINWGFETLQVNRIQATVMVGNLGSARVLEKNGFRQEGTLREYKICRGQAHDYWMFSLLHKEYPSYKS